MRLNITLSLPVITSSLHVLYVRSTWAVIWPIILAGVLCKSRKLRLQTVETGIPICSLCIGSHVSRNHDILSSICWRLGKPNNASTTVADELNGRSGPSASFNAEDHILSAVCTGSLRRPNIGTGCWTAFVETSTGSRQHGAI